MAKLGRYLSSTYRYCIPKCISYPINKTVVLVGNVFTRAKLRAYNKLHLAAGSNIMEDWANLDINHKRGTIWHDLTAPLCVSDDQIQYIYCEHFIEHISSEAATNLLRECHRVLKPGGVLRFSTPNLDFLIKQYQEKNLLEWENVGWLPTSACTMINDGMHLWGHKYLFNIEELINRLESLGFSKVKSVGWRESQHDDLRNLECRPFHHEIIIEATK